MLSRVARLGRQRARETQLVTVRIRDVEVALTPLGVSRFGVRGVTRRQSTVVLRVDVIHVEDTSSPPGPLLVGGLQCQIQIARPCPVAGERAISLAVNTFESERFVEYAYHEIREE